MEEHPGIVFHDGPAGRRAGLANGPDVWEVIVVLKDFGAAGPAAAVKKTARWLGLSEAQVRGPRATTAPTRPRSTIASPRTSSLLTKRNERRRPAPGSTGEAAARRDVSAIGGRRTATAGNRCCGDPGDAVDPRSPRSRGLRRGAARRAVLGHRERSGLRSGRGGLAERAGGAASRSRARRPGAFPRHHRQIVGRLVKALAATVEAGRPEPGTIGGSNRLRAELEAPPAPGTLLSRRRIARLFPATTPIASLGEISQFEADAEIALWDVACLLDGRGVERGGVVGDLAPVAGVGRLAVQTNVTIGEPGGLLFTRHLRAPRRACTRCPRQL